jgi:putative tributyrin esterase
LALVECKFFSEVLGLSTEAWVILPQATSGQIGMAGQATKGPHPTLYLLHGMSDDQTIWLRRTSIERYVSTLGLAVVMPTVHRGRYTDQAVGYPYWTFLSEELPELMRSFFPLSSAREDSFVAGLSMGGYGAFKWALRRPDAFAAAASLSGGLNVARDPSSPEWQATFGSLDRVKVNGDDLFDLATKVGDACPPLYQWCGTDDFLYQDNVRFRDHSRTVGLPLTYEEGPGGHEWACWDLMIQRVLDWLPLRNRPAGG